MKAPVEDAEMNFKERQPSPEFKRVKENETRTLCPSLMYTEDQEICGHHIDPQGHRSTIS